jgi:hypothetical protein
MSIKRRAAVITDSVSDAFYFPLWHKYYSAQFGSGNLYVLTYDGMRKSFNNFELGGIWESDQFNNNVRTNLVSRLIDCLLERYEIVVRADTDEFIVADPRKHTSLKQYIDNLKSPYVTAQGYDVLHGNDEGNIDVTQPILINQRKLAYPFNALNKTCVVSMAVHWAPGFHFASVFPRFEDLYLLHFKRADLEMQLAIGEAVAAHGKDDLLRDYHLSPRAAVVASIQSALQFPGVTGWDGFVRQSYQTKFLEEISFTKNYGGVYHGGAFKPDGVLVTIPQEFAGLF